MPRLKSFYAIAPSNWKLLSDSNEAQAGVEKDLGSKEQVRQWILNELIETYQYPRDWLGTRILTVSPNDTDFQGNNNLFGFYLITTNDQPFLWVSVSEPGHAQAAEKALVSVLLENSCSGVGIATDGSNQGTRFIRRRFDSDQYEYIVDIEPYTSPNASTNSQLWLFRFSDGTGSSSNGRKLIPLSESIENIFFEAHSHIRDVDGMHADEALDELCKVLYVKMYDEEATEASQLCCMQGWLYGSTEELAATARRMYEEANEYDTRVFSLKIPGYQRSRGVFSNLIRLSSPALAAVLETLQKYSITDSTTDVKGRAFQKVIAPTIRAGMGQYLTPDSVVKFMVRVTCPSVSDLILDPFCGSGHFLTTSLQFVRRQSIKTLDKRLHEFAFGKLHGIEKSDRMVRVAMTGMRLQGDGHSNIRCTDSLLDFSNYPDLHPESFDLILTNPPFGSVLRSEAVAQLGEFFLAKARKTVPLEILAIERCIQFLRQGGRLGIVLPEGLLANKKSAYVRDWIESKAKLRAIISLPVETFAPFGANIQTSILFVRKWRRGEKKRQDYPIFLARVDNIGYDAANRPREGIELDHVANEFEVFLNEEGW